MTRRELMALLAGLGVETLKGIPANRLITVREGKGIERAERFPASSK